MIEVRQRRRAKVLHPVSAFFNMIIWCWWDESDVSVNQHNTPFSFCADYSNLWDQMPAIEGADTPTLTTLCCRCLLSVQVQLAWGLFVMRDMITQHWHVNLSEENSGENILLSRSIPLSHTHLHKSTHTFVHSRISFQSQPFLKHFICLRTS